MTNHYNITVNQWKDAFIFKTECLSVSFCLILFTEFSSCVNPFYSNSDNFDQTVHNTYAENNYLKKNAYIFQCFLNI